jgi:hypothetical protein
MLGMADGSVKTATIVYDLGDSVLVNFDDRPANEYDLVTVGKRDKLPCIHGHAYCPICGAQN